MFINFSIIKKIKLQFILLLIVTLSLLSQDKNTELKPYKINGVKEFHYFIKDFIKFSKEGKIEKLTPEQILNKTIDLSRVVIMVDQLSDDDYFQVVYNAIISYKEFLFDNNDFKGKDKKLAEKVITYLDDLEKDLIDQNNENMSADGTRAFRFDIQNFKEDDSPNYDMKQEILKQGPKTAKRYIPLLSKIDEETINKINSVGIELLDLNYFKELPANIAISLIKFKGKKIFFPSLKVIDNEALKILSNFKNEIEFEKLKVTDKNIMVLTTFKASELRIKGLPKKYNKIIKKKLGKRYKRKLKFNKMPK